MRSRLLNGQETILDLLEKLGGIHPGRVRLDPLPGTATETVGVTVKRPIPVFAAASKNLTAAGAVPADGTVSG